MGVISRVKDLIANCIEFQNAHFWPPQANKEYVPLVISVDH